MLAQNLHLGHLHRRLGWSFDFSLVLLWLLQALEEVNQKRQRKNCICLCVCVILSNMMKIIIASNNRIIIWGRMKNWKTEKKIHIQSLLVRSYKFQYFSLMYFFSPPLITFLWCQFCSLSTMTFWNVLSSALISRGSLPLCLILSPLYPPDSVSDVSF